MSQEEFKSYRLTSLEDPSDAMIKHLFNIIAKDVKESNRRSDREFASRLRAASASAQRIRL